MLENMPEYHIYPSNSYFTPMQVLRPDGYQHLLMRLAELRQDAAPFNNPKLIADYNVSWVLLTLSVRIYRQIRPCDPLVAQIWNTWQRGFINRLDIAVWDPEGVPVFSAARFHTLIDYNTRKICREHPVYEAASKTSGPEQFEADSRIPFVPGKGTLVGKRRVLPSWLDLLGHVNNARYGEIIYDCMTSDQRNRMEKLVSLDIYFLHELRIDEEFEVYMDEKESHLELSALKASDRQPAFGAKLVFKTE